MATPQEIREVLVGLGKGPVELAHLVNRNPDAAFDRREPGGGWSGREIVAHLADLEFNLHFTARVARILSEERPELCAAQPDWRALEHRYAYQDPKVAVGAYTLARKHMLAVLSRIAPEDWERVGVHPESGPATLLEVARGFVGHDRRHMARIRELVAAGSGSGGASPE